MEKIKTKIIGMVLAMALLVFLVMPASAGYNCVLTEDLIEYPNGCLGYTMGCLPDWFPSWYTGDYAFYIEGIVCPPEPVKSPCWIA